MKQIDIKPLAETEEGYLIGGFSAFDSPDESDAEALVNGNCATESGLIRNDNCGCHACGTSKSK